MDERVGTSRLRWRGAAGVAAVAAFSLVTTGCGIFSTSSEKSATSGASAGAASGEASAGTSKPAAGPASGTDPASDPKFAAFYGQKLTWSGCEDGFQCTTVKVPVDWKDPAGETITLKATRTPAKKKSARLGTLFVNPGGPGVPGIDFAQSFAGSLPKEIQAAYDIASWDTRGVGESTPVKCLPNNKLDAFYAADGTPDDTAERDALISGTKDYIAACEAGTGPLLEHMDTISTVHDLDLLRALVGDTTLSYFGASYGTFIGAWYAQEFPWRVGRLVLDGAVDPSLDAAGSSAAQAMGFSRAVKAYVTDCLSTPSKCPLRGSETDAYRQLSKMLASADASPLPTQDKRQLTEALMITGMIAGMYSKSSWPYVTQGITEAVAGDGTTLMLLADFYLERDDKGVYGQTLQAYSPIYCLDHGDSRTVDQIAAQAVELAAKYPPFGASMGWGGIGCDLWPYKAVVPTEKVTAEGAAGPILVVGTTGDPATPYESAQALAAMLSTGHLLTREGEGHTGYLQGSTCTDDAVNAYLLKGTVPAKGLRCPT